MSISGPFTLGNMFQLQRVLQEITPQYLVIDLSNVPYMDSAGLGLLVNCYVSAQKHGRKIAVAGVRPRLMTILEMTKVDSLLPLYPNAEAAESAA